MNEEKKIMKFFLEKLNNKNINYTISNFKINTVIIDNEIEIILSFIDNNYIIIYIYAYIYGAKSEQIFNICDSKIILEEIISNIEEILKYKNLIISNFKKINLLNDKNYIRNLKISNIC